MSAQTTAMNSVREINFFCVKNVVGFHVTNVGNYPITHRSIVLNIGCEPMVVAGLPVKSLPPTKSTILVDTEIHSADSIIVIEVPTAENMGSIILQQGWDLAEDLFGEGLKGVPLWRSSPQDVDTIILNPSLVTGQPDTNDKRVTFDVKANLWFAPGQTDCAIHNHAKDDFIEYHVQIHGTGRMQKFKDRTKISLYEDVVLGEGNTHDIFCSVDLETGKFIYPWHQYHADDDCVWMVVELHPRP